MDNNINRFFMADFFCSHNVINLITYYYNVVFFASNKKYYTTNESLDLGVN